MISSHCLSWFFILYGNFAYRIVAGLRFQFKPNNQNASSWLYNIRRGLPTPQKDCHAGKMKLTYMAVLTKNLPIQGTLSINLFWTTKYCYRKQSGKKADGERLPSGKTSGTAWRNGMIMRGQGIPIPSLYFPASYIRQNPFNGGDLRQSAYNDACNSVLLSRIRG